MYDMFVTFNRKTRFLITTSNFDTRMARMTILNDRCNPQNARLIKWSLVGTRKLTDFSSVHCPVGERFGQIRVQYGGVPQQLNQIFENDAKDRNTK